MLQMTHNLQEVVDMWSLVDEEPDWVSLDGDFEHKVGRRPWLHHLAYDAIVVRVDQRLIQVKHQHLALH